MDLIKWRLRQLKQWFIYFIIYRGFWKKLWNSESDYGNWEIWHDNENEKVTLHYVPEDNYSDEDIKIEMSYKEFEDLVKLMIRVA